MRKPVKLVLTSEENEALEQCFGSHLSAAVRKRCQVIMLKVQGRAAADIASIVGMCLISVHSWIKRYRLQGVNGLLTKPGRGRKKVLKAVEDAPAVTQSIQEHRQSLKAAKAAYEAQQGSKQVSEETFRAFFKSLGYRYKRIRRRVGKAPDKDFYDYKVMCLQELERLSQQGLIDLYYGDETGVSTEGYCPYGWQGKAEKVSVAALPTSRQRLNCFGCISRNNQFYYATSSEAINGDFIIGQLDIISNLICKPTFLVLDNARIHKTKELQQRYEQWQSRGLYIFYRPPYSPHLNIAETLWRVLKGRWLEVKDYLSAEALFEATHKYLSEVGTKRTINYAPFNTN